MILLNADIIKKQICPKCSKPISFTTGVLPDFHGYFFCPYCHYEGEWKVGGSKNTFIDITEGRFHDLCDCEIKAIDGELKACCLDHGLEVCPMCKKELLNGKYICEDFQINSESPD